MSNRWDEKSHSREGTQISMRWVGGAVVFDVQGYFNEESEPLINAVYEEACALGAVRLLLNFDGHGLITSAGYGLIIKLLRRVREKDQELRIAHPSEHTRRMFQIMGLMHAVPVHASEEEAIEAFKDRD